MKIVVKIGGSLAIGSSGPRKEWFRPAEPVMKRVANDHQVIFAIGGGRLIRDYQARIRDFALEDDEVEEIFIELIKANVRFVASLLKTKPIFALDDIDEDTSGVIGGIVPGRSTDANAAEAALIIGADLMVKMTNVDGIYDSDPAKNEDAKKLDRVPFAELENYAVPGKPGSYGVLDSTAMKIITENKIPTRVISGRNPENLLKAINGKGGTLIG